MATSIYPVLISKINDTLNGVSNIKEVFAYPATKLTKYPTAIFFPSGFDNQYATTAENMKTYEFKVYIVVGAKQKSIQDIYNTVMPNTVDAVIEQFDNEWDYDVIDGNRVWTQLETGGWSVSSEQDNLEVTAELTLLIKVLTNN